MGHAVPVRPSEGCGTTGAYTADLICSTAYITADWGLGDTGPGDPGDPGTPACFTASNYTHVLQGRATVRYGYAYAVGSGDALGLWNVHTVTSLTETGPGRYERTASCG
jgi:feruloyl esterase